MDDHDTQEETWPKAAWRERNAGADAPGTGQPPEDSAELYADTEPTKAARTKTALGRRKT